ncbi:MAG: Prevent-host-death family protein [Microgenomates group bacterium GW2011_GWC1_49_7]|nr:MAG: Prevent-host-death family protein [Microgenomates group bacterium GW2011_GWC1_49_7]
MSTLPATLTASEARTNLYDMLEEVRKFTRRFTITHRGKPHAVVMPIEDLEGMQETIEILSDKKLMRQIDQGMKDYKAGRYSTLEEVKKRLKL